MHNYVKRLLLFVSALACSTLFPSLVHAQGQQIPIPVTQGPSGAPKAGATITVCNSPATGGVPCTNYASIFSDVALTQPITQPGTTLKTDGLGNCCVIGTAPVTIYAAPGIYTYTVSGTGIAAPQGPYTVTAPCIPNVTCISSSTLSAGQNAINMYNENHRVWSGPITNKYTTIGGGLGDPFCSSSTSICQLNLTSDFNESFTSTYTLGNNTNQRVHLRGIPGANVTCSITSGAACFQLNNGNSVTGEIPGAITLGGGGGGAGGFFFSYPTTANIKCMFCTNSGTGNSYIRLEDFFVFGSFNAGSIGTVGTAIVDYSGLYNLSIARDIYLAQFPTVGWRVNGGGPLLIQNIWSDSVYAAAGSQPCDLESTTTNVLFSVQWVSGVCNHPGSGKPMFNLNGHGGNGVAAPTMLGIGIHGTYVENGQNGSSVGFKIADATSVNIGESHSLIRDTDTLFDISETLAGLTCAINLHTMYKQSPTNGATMINNHISGFTATTPSSLNYYLFGGDASCNTMPFTMDSMDFQMYGLSNNKIFSIPARSGTDASPGAYYFPASSATLGNAVFRNRLDQILQVNLDSGLTAAQQVRLAFSDRGTDKWYTYKDASNAYNVYDVASANSRIQFPTGATFPTTGQVRLANTEHVCWENAAASAGDCLGEVQTQSAAGCTTTGGATAFTGSCNTTVTWPSAFADTSYRTTCTGYATFTGVPILQGVVSFTAASVIVATQQATGVNASFQNIVCTGVHQ